MDRTILNECSGQIINAAMHKAVTKVNPVHEATLLTYLKMSDRRLGLLMNFHELRLRDGLKRIVHRF